MRKFTSKPLVDAFNNQDPILGPFYADLFYEDRFFVRDCISHLPRVAQLILIEQYQNKATRFLANTYLRETVAALNGFIPNILLSNFDAGEEELRILARATADKCRYFERMVYTAKCGHFTSKLVKAGKDSGSTNDLLIDNLQNTVYEKCTSYATDKGVNPPMPKSRVSVEGCIRRMQDEGWWLRKLRRIIGKSRETIMVHLNKVNKRNGLYCSDLTARYRRMQKQQQLEAMRHIYVTNEMGDEFTLYDLYEKNVSNPVNRRNELMTRMSGFEKLSKELEHQALFITLTCPSKYHNSYAKSGDRNPKWDGSTAHDGQMYLCIVWARIRAELQRRDISVYGLRVAEPQHDGTPHWHLILFASPNQINEIKQVTSEYSLAEDTDEQGAEENRVKYVDIDPQKGSATGYVAKYVCKNIDGEDLEEGVYGENPIEAAQRVEAWASCWGIRQFQQIGGVSVTVWREIRRLRQITETDEELSSLYKAADSGDWALFTTLMGGVFCKRKDQAIRPHYDIEVNPDSGLIKSSWFDGIPTLKLKGIVHKGVEIITRVHQWSLERRCEKTAPALQSLLGVL